MFLRPEFAYNVEIGIQKYFNDRKFRLGFNAYYTLLEHYIIRDDFVVNDTSTILYDGEVGNLMPIKTGKRHTFLATLAAIKENYLKRLIRPVLSHIPKDELMILMSLYHQYHLFLDNSI